MQATKHAKVTVCPHFKRPALVLFYNVLRIQQITEALRNVFIRQHHTHRQDRHESERGTHNHVGRCATKAVLGNATQPSLVELSNTTTLPDLNHGDHFITKEAIFFGRWLTF